MEVGDHYAEIAADFSFFDVLVICLWSARSHRACHHKRSPKPPPADCDRVGRFAFSDHSAFHPHPNLDPATRTPLPFPSATAIPSGPLAHAPGGEPIDCHRGPAKEYQPGVTNEFTGSAEIVGVNQQGGWWYVRVQERDGALVYCWVIEKSVTTHVRDAINR